MTAEEEYAVFFDNGVWIVSRKNEFGNVNHLPACPSLEAAIMEASLATGAPVGIKLITRQK